MVAIENLNSAIDQIAQTTLRKLVGQHPLGEQLSETGRPVTESWLRGAARALARR